MPVARTGLAARVAKTDRAADFVRMAASFVVDTLAERLGSADSTVVGANIEAGSRMALDSDIPAALDSLPGKALRAFPVHIASKVVLGTAVR